VDWETKAFASTTTENSNLLEKRFILKTKISQSQSKKTMLKTIWERTESTYWLNSMSLKKYFSRETLSLIKYCRFEANLMCLGEQSTLGYHGHPTSGKSVRNWKSCSGKAFEFLK
jgi:hypothetical protein